MYENINDLQPDVEGLEPTTILYARVSTKDQKLDGQVNELERFARRNGWRYRVVTEKASGAKSQPALNHLLNNLAVANVKRVVVYDLTRLARKGVQDVIDKITLMQKAGVELVSFSQQLNFKGEIGLVMASMLGAFAKIDYDLRREKQAAGISAARDKNGGVCPWGGSKAKRGSRYDEYVRGLRSQGKTVKKIAKFLKVSTRTVQDSMIRQGIQPKQIREQQRLCAEQIERDDAAERRAAE